MQLNKKDREIMLRATTTEMSRIKRQINTEQNQAIKEIHQTELQAVTELHGRVFNEVAK